MTKTRHIGLIAALSIGLMGTAHAQSTSVDATATPVYTTTPLVLTGTRALSFGEVNIPNGTEEGHKCQYDLGVAPIDAYGSLRELDETGSSAAFGAPTPSGCNWGSSGTFSGEFSVFEVSCNPASSIDFTPNWTNGVATGMELATPTLTSIGAFSDDGFTDLLIEGNSFGVSATCPEKGSLYVAIGGRLRVDETAVAGTDVLIGTVTLDATY